MTARQRVRRTQRALGVVVGSGALFWSGAVLFAGLVLAALINAVIAMSPAVRGILPLVAIVGALGVLGWLVWRGRFAWSFDRVALWIEERAPELRYALVTAVDPRYAESMGPAMEPLVSRVDTGAFVRKAATHSTLPALVALIVTASIFAFLPDTIKPKLNTSAIWGGPAVPAIVGNRLVPLSGTVTPPAYAEMRSQSLRDPSTIVGLFGSQVRLTGHGTPDGIKVTIGRPDSTPLVLPVTAGGDGWTVSFGLRDSVGLLLTLVDRQYHRLIVVDPRMDESPSVRLLKPVRDTTLRTIAGTLSLSADFGDDVGLGKAVFEYIVSNNTEGDAAEARSGTFGTRVVNGQTGSYSLDLPYTSLGLKEGDQLSVRAVVYDNNTLTGPGKGYSETRTIRIATKSEYDTLNINAAPPSADTAILSLKMLIMSTETLETKRPKMERNAFIDQSYKKAGQGQVILQKIERIVDEQTGGGEIAINPLLAIARDTMWEAVRSLQVTETWVAIPQMYIVLHALEKLRDEKKYFPKGKLRVGLVNIDRVRMTGQDTGKATPTDLRPPAATDKDRLRRSYMEALGVLRTAPDSAITTFTIIRVQALRQYPKLAAALGEAVSAIQAKRDYTQPLLQARRELEGNATIIDTLPLWSGAW